MKQKEPTTYHLSSLPAGRFNTRQSPGRRQYNIWKSLILTGVIICQTGMLHASHLPPDSMVYTDQLHQRAVAALQKNLDTTWYYAIRSRDLATRRQYAKGIADAWQVLGSYYELCHNKYLSVRYYTDALQAYTQQQYLPGTGRLYAHLGTYYQQSGQSAMAATYAHKAMATSRQLPDDLTRAFILTRYASIFLNDPGKKDSVQWALTSARNSCTRYRDTAGLLQLEQLQIQQLLAQHDTATAIHQLNDLHTRATATGYYYPAVQAARLLTAISARRQQPDTIQYMTLMVQAAQAGGYREQMMPVAIQLADWYTRQGKPDSALPYNQLLLNILDKKEADKTNGEMDYLSYYLQQHNLHSLQLQQDIQQSRLHRLQLENRNRFLLTACLIILLVLAALAEIYFFRAYRRTHKDARLLGIKNREILEKNTLLLSHDDFKNKLVSVIAHDSRAPLSNVINITTFLRKEMLSPDEAAEWMMEVEHATGYTLQIFDNILTWISSQVAGFVYEPESCKPADMVPEVVRFLSGMINAKHLQVIINIPGTTTVWANREMLQFIHRNFIHNAIKFSPVSSTLRILAETDKDRVTLSVTDEGPGIPPDLLPNLFEFNHKKGSKNEQQGAGLALIICRDFISKMGGQLQVTNLPEKGARFSYTLPPANPHQLLPS
ncbi:sensor histidine kinase [Chitinophaga nivalis]|uniref:histidine kinase n=1 Tax=Chitinophaga nivalis TaxID=2991709 RepID=A0ABT3IMR1_9BACT|nr:HAMP domain-containing sensor histidine kinase [Chitinophaga nivalis]MCW3465053.1 HAMP domain-containing histidine kinase [Chitinophaga nivalis]MCW3485255.1 HAMP domain-containing histidine kinase [Chitinophaga nivalis]